jgi:hypothetical protein
MPEVNRREFLGSTAAAAGMAWLPDNASGESSGPAQNKSTRWRTMYFNDARHFYLYSFEPPLTMEEAWRPVDDVVGTAVDTLIYGVSSGGLFSDTKVAYRWGSEQKEHSAIGWRAWNNMQSLIDRGLDPLQVLIDRAHDQGIEFITSMRIGDSTKNPEHRIGGKGVGDAGGRNSEIYLNFAIQEVRDTRYAWLEELAGYNCNGIELDFAFTPDYFKLKEVGKYTPVMTDYVRSISKMIRDKGRTVVGARVFPSEELNLACGLDVRTWLKEGLIDYAAPLVYVNWQLDPHLNIDWMTKVARESNAAVYPVLQPYYVDYGDHASPAMLRSAVANYAARGAGGVIAWFLQWPFGETERFILTEIGDPSLLASADKHYIIPHRNDSTAPLGYDQALPMSIDKVGARNAGEIPFYIADDLKGDGSARVRLQMKVKGMVTADTLDIRLNGDSIPNDRIRKTTHRYEHMWLDCELKDVLPAQGRNVLSFAIESRPKGLIGGARVELVEILIEHERPHRLANRPAAL